jgi:hypothetical protein
MLNVMRIDRGAHIQRDCKEASQETNKSEIDIREYKHWRKLKRPAYSSRHSD